VAASASGTGSPALTISTSGRPLHRLREIRYSIAKPPDAERSPTLAASRQATASIVPDA